MNHYANGQCNNDAGWIHHVVIVRIVVGISIGGGGGGTAAAATGIEDCHCGCYSCTFLL